MILRSIDSLDYAMAKYIEFARLDSSLSAACRYISVTCVEECPMKKGTSFSANPIIYLQISLGDFKLEY